MWLFLTPSATDHHFGVMNYLVFYDEWSADIIYFAQHFHRKFLSPWNNTTGSSWRWGFVSFCFYCFLSNNKIWLNMNSLYKLAIHKITSAITSAVTIIYLSPANKSELAAIWHVIIFCGFFENFYFTFANTLGNLARDLRALQ